MIDRRRFTLSAGAALLVPATVRAAPDPAAPIAAIERTAGIRLGAFVLDTGSGRSVGWRADERFCHCSTFKFSLAAAVLREGDAGRLDLDRTLPFGRADLIDNSPVSEAHLAAGRMSIAEMAQAVQTVSDNTAANLLLRHIGGPATLTRFWRAIGDPVSRLDGYEPAINVIPPGTQENSTTPRAMADTVRRIVLGDVLHPASRARLRGWMAATRTGTRRIRAGVPSGWGVLDKTGTGMRAGIGNKTNDLAVLLPPGGRAPIVVTGYVETPAYSDDVRAQDEAALARLGAFAVSWAAAR